MTEAERQWFQKGWDESLRATLAVLYLASKRLDWDDELQDGLRHAIEVLEDLLVKKELS